MPLISCKDLSVTFGESHILERADLAIEAGERVCITGRNGTGKSTLLRLIEGRMEPDSGTIWRSPGVGIATLQQSLPTGEHTVYDVIASAFSDTGERLAEYHHLLQQMGAGDFPESARKRLERLHDEIDHANGWDFGHRIDAVLDQFSLDGDEPLARLSGGWRRRVAIARSLVTDPDVWLLDEPTNHLDIPTIEWLEARLLEFEGTIVFVTHDRQLMQRVATSIIDIDRGRLTRWDCDYTSFVARKAHQLDVEATHQREFDKRLDKEEAWIREGIKARRTRNEGRVRALEQMRLERSKRRETGKLKLDADSGERSGKLVKVVEGVSKRYDDRQVISDLDLIIQRGDRIGILGPNGAGKSTLLRLLLEQEQPDSGIVRTGTRLDVAYFDQVRDQIDPERSVADTITEGREWIEIGNKRTHVVTYLQNFMFTPDQARSPVRVLSGGEQNRLMLAKLFSGPANLLVLDEPTNDLDVESLELLEELLIDYDGTVLLVTHDRTFLDNVVSSLLVFEGEGRVTEFVGGYSDWRRGGGRFSSAGGRTREGATNGSAKPAPQTERSHEERREDKRERQKRERELDALPGKIEAVEAKIEALHERMADPGFYDGPPNERAKAEGELAEATAERDRLYARWEALEA